MPHALVGAALIVHGLITTMIGFGSVTSPNPAAMTMPAWLGWWPGTLGRSWVLDSLNAGSGLALLGGLLWLTAGLALIGAGLGWLGFSALSDQWPMLALIGGALGLLALALYFHPLYLAAVVIDIVIVAMVWGRIAAAR